MKNLRRTGSFLLSFVILASVMFTSTPVTAATMQMEVKNYDKHPQFQQLNEAYIEYSEQAEKMGKFVMLPLEYFVIEYQPDISMRGKTLDDNKGIDAYLASRISELDQNISIAEIRAEQAKMQSIIEKEGLTENNKIGTRSAGGYWFYNCPELIKAGNYKKYPKLLGSAVVSGDLVHDDKGSFGITGHSAIVMGHYYSSIYKEYYVRVCEAVSAGVTYGILSDDRVVNRASSVYRVNGGANSTKRIKAANWVASQRGKPWSPSTKNFKTEKISKSRPNWYCSLLVYAAYKAQGINIGDKGGTGAIMPRHLRDSARTSKTF